MYKIVFSFLVLAMISCSKYENGIMNTSYSILSEIHQLRNRENKVLISKMDSVIRGQGDRDREICIRLDNALLKVDRCEFADKEVIAELKHILHQTDFDMYARYGLENVLKDMDTVALGAIKSMLNQRLINNYASMIGAAGCEHFNPVQPHLTFKSSVIQPGHPVELRFFLGPTGNSPPLLDESGGKDLIHDGMEVRFFPDQHPGEYVWKGFYLNGKDTVRIVIPYEIMDCPDGNG